MAQVDSENSITAPASDAGGLYIPTDVTPEDLFLAIGRLRKEAGDEVDRLLQFLDETDDYVFRELEPNGDELDASFPERGSSMLSNPNEDDELSGDESEPSLGSGAVGENSNQGQWALVGTDDREDEHDGAEPDEADNEASAGFDVGEPSLGWPERISQAAHPGNYDDRELALHTSMPAHKRAQMDQPAKRGLDNIAEPSRYGDRRRRGFRISRKGDEPNSRGLR
jgi:hypothetical protein